MTWGIWIVEYECGEGLQRFWLTDGMGNHLTYESMEAATAMCREWFGQVPEHMTVREYQSEGPADAQG